MLFNGRVKMRMSADQPIIMRLPKCPTCGSFMIASLGLVMNLSDGKVSKGDDFTWWCLDCGHRKGDVLPEEE